MMQWAPGRDSVVSVLFATLLALLGSSGCDPNVTTVDAKGKEVAKGDDKTIELIFTYGSEKEEWIKDVTAAFNKSSQTVKGKTVVVKAVPTGSGECIEDLLSGKVKAHLTSPASAAFIQIGNAESKAKGGK